MSKGKTSFFSKLLIFLFGFIFAIILEAGVIIGGALIIANTDIEQLFQICGIENKDENGDQYVNTDLENGGYKTPLDLVNGIAGMFANIDTMTLAEVEKVFPASKSLVNTVDEYLSPYVEIDKEELKAVKFVEFGDYLQKVIVNIEPARLLNGLEMGDVIDSNVIIEAVLVGTEFSYVEDTANNLKYPVYYTDYKKITVGEDVLYVTANDDTPYPLTDVSWLTDLGGGNYRVYYYLVTAPEGVSPASAYFLTDKDYTYFDRATPYALEISEVNLQRTGYYYYDAEGNRVQDKKITFETLTQDAFEPLATVMATELLDPDGNDELIQKAFAGITVADILTGNLSVDQIMDKLYLPDVLDVAGDNAILKYLAYNVTDAIYYDSVQTTSDGSTYTQKGVFTDADGNSHECYITTDSATGNVSKVFYFDGETRVDVDGVAIADVSDQIANITDALRLSDVLGDVEPTNKIMVYVNYSLVNVNAISGEEYAYTAVYKYIDASGAIIETPCYVYVKTVNGTMVIDKVISQTTGERILSIKVSQISNKIDNLTSIIEIGDIMDIASDDTMLVKLKHSTIDSLSSDMKNLTVQEIYCLDVYGKSQPDLATAYNPYFIYYTFEVDYYKSVGKLTQEQFESGTYYTFGAPSGIWNLLLCVPTDTTTGKVYNDTPCKIGEMNDLITRMQSNINQATLLELKDFGIITDEKGNLSSTVVPVRKVIISSEADKVSGTKYVAIPSGGYYTFEVKLLGNCTVNEVVDLVDLVTSTEYAIWLTTAE